MASFSFSRSLVASLRALDGKAIDWMRRRGVPMLQMALAVIFIWFGALKTFGASPADDIVRRTVYWFSADAFVPLLGVWEMLIGVCLLFRPLLRVGLLLLFFQLPGTFLPLLVLPDVCFVQFPFGLTMEGQYIVKNLLIIGAAIVLGGSMHAMKASPLPTGSSKRPRDGA